MFILIIIQKISQRRDSNVTPQEKPKVTQPTPILSKKTYYREDTAPEDGAESTDKYHLINYPDVYLSNQTPFSNDFFSITSEFINTPAGHFRFLVELKGTEQNAKKEFQKWLLSLGFNSTRIDQLDIVYQKPAD